MCSARRILKAKRFDVVAEFRQRSCRAGSGQAGADDDDVELPLVRRIDQLEIKLMPIPARRDIARRARSIAAGMSLDLLSRDLQP